MCLSACACLRACALVLVRVRVHARVRVCMYVYVCVRVRVLVLVCIFIYIHLHVCLRAWSSLWSFERRLLRKWTCTYVVQMSSGLCVRVYVRVCACACARVHVHVNVRVRVRASSFLSCSSMTIYTPLFTAISHFADIVFTAVECATIEPFSKPLKVMITCHTYIILYFA